MVPPLHCPNLNEKLCQQALPPGVCVGASGEARPTRRGGVSCLSDDRGTGHRSGERIGMDADAVLVVVSRGKDRRGSVGKRRPGVAKIAWTPWRPGRLVAAL